MNKREENIILTPAVFHILLALYDSERHGYEIMKRVEVDSNRLVKMGPGTLYGSIKRMLADGLIEESDMRPDPSLDDERRRYYRITEKGTSLLQTEVQRLAEAVNLARKRKLGTRTFSCHYLNESIKL
jgi:DNA-binding PadR family transcriptional regulator